MADPDPSVPDLSVLARRAVVAAIAGKDLLTLPVEFDHLRRVMDREPWRWDDTVRQILEEAGIPYPLARMVKVVITTDITQILDEEIPSNIP